MSDDTTQQGPILLVDIEEDTENGALTVPRSILRVKKEETPASGMQVRGVEGRDSTQNKALQQPGKGIGEMGDDELLNLLEGDGGNTQRSYSPDSKPGEELLLPLEEEAGTVVEGTRDCTPPKGPALRLAAQVERQAEAEATVLDPPRRESEDVEGMDETHLNGPETILEAHLLGFPLQKNEEGMPMLAVGFWLIAGGFVIIVGFLAALIVVLK